MNQQTRVFKNFQETRISIEDKKNNENKKSTLDKACYDKNDAANYVPNI